MSPRILFDPCLIYRDAFNSLSALEFSICLLFLISYLIPLCSDSRHCVISTLLNFLGEFCSHLRSRLGGHSN